MTIATILASVLVGYVVMFNLGRNYERRRVRSWLSYNWTVTYKLSMDYSGIMNQSNLPAEKWFIFMYGVVTDLFMEDYSEMSYRDRKFHTEEIRKEIEYGQRKGN